MRLTVSSRSFGDYFDPKKFGIFKCMDWAKEMGFEAMEMVKRDVDTYGYDYKEIGDYAKAIGLPINVYLINKDFLRYRGTRVEEEIADAIAEVDNAILFGAPMLRHDITHCDLKRKHGVGLDDVLPILVDACRRVTEYAQERGIRTSFENHGHFLQEAAMCERLINAVDSENFGLTLDTGNSITVDEDTAYSVGKLTRYAFHVHAKDYHVKAGGFESPGEGWTLSRGGNYYRGAIIGHGDANVARSVRALKLHGYDGDIAIEFEGLEDHLKGIRISRDNMLRYLGK